MGKNNLDSSTHIKRIVPYVSLFLCMLLLHMNMDLAHSDDSHFKIILTEKSLFDHVLNLYLNVNGKIFTDMMPAIFTYIPSVFFKVLNSLIFVIIAFSISNVFLDSTLEGDVAACLFVLLFPMDLLTSAGYVATSTNYIWTTASLFVILLGIKWWKELQNSKLCFIIWTLALLYAGNQEQTCVATIMVFVSLVVKDLIMHTWEKRYYIYGLVIECLSLLFVMTSPGHMKRTDGYSIFRIPNYPQLNLLDKVYLGITTTISHYLSFDNIVFLCFSILIIYIVWKERSELVYRFYSVIPLASVIFIELINKVDKFAKLRQVFCFNFEWGYGQRTFSMIDASNYDCVEVYLPICLCILLIISILICFRVIAQNDVEFYICLFLMLIGFATRAVMGFSPTLFGSGTRTYIYLYFSFISICTIISYRYLIQKSKFVWSLVLVSVIISFISSYNGILS